MSKILEEDTHIFCFHDFKNLDKLAKLMNEEGIDIKNINIKNIWHYIDHSWIEPVDMSGITKYRGGINKFKCYYTLKNILSN